MDDNPDAKFVVVDYGDTGELGTFFRTSYWPGILRAGQLTVYNDPYADVFRMAHAKNMAHRCGILEGADILVNLDADNFTGPGFASAIAEQFNADHNVFLWAKMIRGVLPRGIHGRIAVTRHAFLNAGGYDEKYDIWGPDDKDFNARLTRLGYEPREIDVRFLERGVPHNDKVRFREYPHAEHQQKNGANGYDRFDLSESTNTIANFGKCGLGTVYKNYGGEPIELKPIPTRIFGIGMHKTATTSLHHAFETLGLDSAHWKNAHWAKAIWKEMVGQGRSITLEKSYALCDLPITILFRQLDKAYPGSKFILTVKDEQKWLHDVRDHWGYETNRYRYSWDKDPFTHKLHTLVYGQRHFDADVFLNRYRAHNAEVLEYFRDRPGDLLVMDMDGGAGWEQLCSFLGCAIPEAEYPRIDPTRPEPIGDFIKWV